KSLRRLNIQPNYISETEMSEPTAEVTVKVPDVTGMKGALAKEKLKVAGLSNEFIGEGAIIEQQIPAAGSLVHPTQTVYLITEQKQDVKVPDLTGVSLRDAVEICALLGIKLQIEGNGYIISQHETENNGVKTVHVQLSPLPESEFYNEATANAGDGEATDDEAALDHEGEESESTDVEQGDDS